jgi:hypothetical protein
MDAAALLATLAAWHPRLLQVSETDADRVVGSKWTRKELLGHLLDSAVNNHQRFVRLRQGELRGFPGYEADAWVEAGAYRSASWSQLLSLWHLFNLQLAAVVREIPETAAGHRWADKDVDLDFLVRDYTAHMLHHLERMQL